MDRQPGAMGGPGCDPQKFLDIPKARAADFVKATERVYFGGADGSRIQLRIAE